MKTIKKKILPNYYTDVITHRKTFELRKDDDNFCVGDIIDLCEWDGEKYTGRHTKREITYILRGVPEYGLKDGYCILALQPIGWDTTFVYDPRAAASNTYLSSAT